MTENVSAIGTDELLLALDLPAGSRVDQRVPKKLLLENGAATAADRRHINDGIEELFWIAALKPETIGVPAYTDDVREYLEIAVLRVTLRAGSKAARLLDIIHRAIPYPLLLLSDRGGRPGLSAAPRRQSQGEAGKVVLASEVVAVEQDLTCDQENWPAFCRALALGRQPRVSLYSLYDGWTNAVLALHAARVTGTFSIAPSSESARARQLALIEAKRLDAEIARLRFAASKERQAQRQVELNLQAKRVEAQLVTVRSHL